MKKLNIVFLLSVLSISTFAQNSIDLLTVSGRYGLPSAYEQPYDSTSANETGLLVNVKAPIVFNDKFIWYNNLTYTHFNVQSDLNLGDSIMNHIKLHAFIMQTGLVYKIDDRSALQLLFVPRFMTDFVNVDGGAFQFGAIGLYERKFSERLTLRFGAMFNQELSGPLVVPLVDVNWKIGSRWSVTGLLPIYAKLNYFVSEKFTLGISHFGLITSYKLGDPNYAGDYMERTSIDLALFGRYNLFGNWHAEGRFGYALSREYAQYAADDQVDFSLSIIKFGDDRMPKNVLFNDGIIANIRLVYSMPLE